MSLSKVDVLNAIPILEIAEALGIEVLRNNKAMCFTGHDTRTPSLSFVPHDNYWKCFGCGLSGKNIELVKQVNGISFKEALIWFENYKKGGLRNTNRISKPTFVIDRSKPRICKPDSELYEWFVEQCGFSCRGRKYLHDRCFDDRTINEFNIKEIVSPEKMKFCMIEKWGYERVSNCGFSFGKNWSESLVIPFYCGKRIVYVLRRNYSHDESKYTNMTGMPTPHLFNMNALSGLQEDSELFICEGITDTLMAHQCGLRAIGILGAQGIKKELIQATAKYRIIMIPDNDNAGKKSCHRLKDMYYQMYGKLICQLDIGTHNDFCDFVKAKRGC